jgi:hypothetical protein
MPTGKHLPALGATVGCRVEPPLTTLLLDVTTRLGVLVVVGRLVVVATVVMSGIGVTNLDGQNRPGTCLK